MCEPVLWLCRAKGALKLCVEDENPLIDAHRVPLSLAELKVRFLSRQLQKQKEELCVRRPVS